MKLVLLRHGASVWNQENKFTGWKDVDLAPEGLSQAKNAGIIMKQKVEHFDVCFTSCLKRAIKTAHIALEEMEQLSIPVNKSWRLNERHYGALQGKNKAEVALEYGEDQIKKWRRGFDESPPKDPNESGEINGESLKEAFDRIGPYWNEFVKPQLKDGKNVLVVAHSNTLRAIGKEIENLSDEELLSYEFETGKPVLFDVDRDLMFRREDD